MDININAVTDRIRRVGSGVWIGLLLASLLVFAANTLYAATKAARFGGASTAASSLQVNSQRLASQARDAMTGKAEAFTAFKATQRQIDDDLKRLNNNFGHSDLGRPIKTVTDRWATLGKYAEQLIASERAILGLADNANHVVQRMPQLHTQLDEVVRAMSADGAASSQIYISLRQVVLATTMTQHIAELRAGGPVAAKAGAALGRDIGVFQQVMDGLREGGGGRAQRVSAAAAAPLNQANVLWLEVRRNLDAVMATSTALLRAQDAVAQLGAGSDPLLAESEDLFRSLTAFGSLRDTSVIGGVWISILSGLLVLVALVGLYFSTRRLEHAQSQARLQADDRDHDAVVRLQGDIGALAGGDLTVKAIATAGMAGAVADSINGAVEQLRNRIRAITDTSGQVAASVQETQATASRLVERTKQQAQEINSTMDKIGESANHIDRVACGCAESIEVVQRLLHNANQGAARVRETAAVLDSIRGSIEQTSKQVQRLGENSREIGASLVLIKDLSEQTNLLVLNAAIQAASAGGAGRGLVLVVEEVQRLAEDISNAAKRIETRVHAIQADSNTAINSIGQAAAEAAAGADRANDAGAALDGIESAASNLVGIIRGISGAAQQQSNAVSDIGSAINAILAVTVQTADDGNQAARSLTTLVQLATQLRGSVAGFKLQDPL